MEKKVTRSCPSCKQKVKVTKDTQVKITCPHCSNEVEIDGTVRSKGSKSILTKKYLFHWFMVGVTASLLRIGYDYFFNKKDEVSTHQSQDITSVEDSVILRSLITAIDVGNPTTNDFAVRLASRFPGEYNIAQVCRIHDYIVKKWKYVSDSDKQEIFRSASRTIQNDFAGDCDDFAILMSALIESIGGDVRISFAQNQEEGHAFAEVYATDKEEEMQILADDMSRLYEAEKFEIKYYVDERGGCWLNLDWFGEHQHPGGEYFNFDERTIYYPFGYPNNDPNQRVPTFERESN